MSEHYYPPMPHTPSCESAAAGADDSLERDDDVFTLADLAAIEEQRNRVALYEALQHGERYVNPVPPLHPDLRTLRRRM